MYCPRKNGRPWELQLYHFVHRKVTRLATFAISPRSRTREGPHYFIAWGVCLSLMRYFYPVTRVCVTYLFPVPHAARRAMAAAVLSFLHDHCPIPDRHCRPSGAPFPQCHCTKIRQRKEQRKGTFLGGARTALFTPAILPVLPPGGPLQGHHTPNSCAPQGVQHHLR